MDHADPIAAAFEELTSGTGMNAGWTRDGSVSGFGIGLRRTMGAYDGERCLKVFVHRKQPRQRLAEPIPPALLLTGSGAVVPVDVEEISPLISQATTAVAAAPDAGRNAVRSAQPGSSWGSYGFVLRHRFDERTYLLGSGHVLAGGSSPRIGDRIMLCDGTPEGRPAARLTAWTTPVPSDAGFPNRLDAGLAEIDRPETVARLSGTLPNGISGDIRSGMRLHLAGAASGRQRTTVVCERATFCVEAEVPSIGRRRVGFRDQAFCRAATLPGDSGASLINDRGRAVGLHGWGSGGRGEDGAGEISVFTPITTILDAFTKNRELDLVTDTDVITMPLDRPPVDDLDDAIDLVARTLYGEARREPSETRFAIAEVVYNRAIQRSPRFGLSVEAVCRQPDQFSCWNPGDPSRSRTLSISLADPEIAECVTIARDLVAGRVGGLTLGADHFHHRRVSPYYSREHAPCAQIGNYVFFNDIP